MSKMNNSSWVGAFDILLGLLSILLSTMVLAYPGLDTLTLVLMLVSALLVIGLARIIVGLFGEHIPDWLRALNVGAGLLGVVITIANMLFPQYITQALIQLLSAALLINGLTSALVGTLAADLPNLPRRLFMIFGIICIALSVAAFISTPLQLTSFYILSLGYLLSGVTEISLGLTWIRRGERDDILGKVDSMIRKGS